MFSFCVFFLFCDHVLDFDIAYYTLHQAPYNTPYDVASNPRSLGQVAEQAYLSYEDALQRTECESMETTVRTRWLLWSGALLRMMGNYRLPKRVMSGKIENAGKRGPGGKEKKWADCMAEDRRLFSITGDWSTAAALDPGVCWYSAVREGGCRFMTAWVK